MYRTALRNLMAHKGRLLMTMLAVLLGTAFVAGTMVFSDSVGQAFKDSQSSSYDNISVQVHNSAAGTDSKASDNNSSALPLTDATVRKIAALPGAQSARGTVTGFAGLSDPQGNLIGERGSTQGSNWAAGADGRDSTYPMTQGTGPVNAQQIAVDQRTAEKNGFKVGDTVRLAVNGPVMQMTVTGIFTTVDPQVKAGGSLVLFDTVPGGAGGALRIARSFDAVLETASRRLARCECGEETSCYGCLRNFRNQAFHEQLRRGDALAFLSSLSAR